MRNGGNSQPKGEGKGSGKKDLVGRRMRDVGEGSEPGCPVGDEAVLWRP